MITFTSDTFPSLKSKLVLKLKTFKSHLIVFNRKFYEKVALNKIFYANTNKTDNTNNTNKYAY